MKTILKGGSLNYTELFDLKDRIFVRKTIKRTQNREYGFVRWYSQLKKLQKFNDLFPNSVPQILDIGVTDDFAYFDMEYVKGSNLKKHLQTETLSTEDLAKINRSLWDMFDMIHSRVYSSSKSSLLLYYYEEVEQKLKEALQNKNFKDFYDLGYYHYKDNMVVGFQRFEVEYKKMFEESLSNECYIHGNPTLENIMYNPVADKITFIDLYDESMIDSNLLDYSQVLQCSSSGYGVINDGIKIINEGNVSSPTILNKNFVKFNSLFMDTLESKFSYQQIKMIQLFESTQFFRMLPFKILSGDIEGAKYFYTHACSLVNKII